MKPFYSSMAFTVPVFSQMVVMCAQRGDTEAFEGVWVQRSPAESGLSG